MQTIELLIYCRRHLILQSSVQVLFSGLPKLSGRILLIDPIRVIMDSYDLPCMV
jgi:hypothetical protein